MGEATVTVDAHRSNGRTQAVEVLVEYVEVMAPSLAGSTSLPKRGPRSSVYGSMVVPPPLPKE